MNKDFANNLVNTPDYEHEPFDMSELKPLTVYPNAMNSGAAIYPATIVEGQIDNFGTAVAQGNMGQDFYPTTVSGTTSVYSNSNINSCTSVSLRTISEGFHKGDGHNLGELSGSTFLAKPTTEQYQTKDKSCTNSKSNFYKIEIKYDLAKKPNYKNADQIAKVDLHKFLRYSHVQFLAEYYL